MNSKILAMGAIFCAFLMLAVPISMASDIYTPRPITEPELPAVTPVEYNQQIIDYAQALPASAFKNNGLRTQMMNQLNSIQKDLVDGKLSEALKTIKNHFIPNLDMWMVDDAAEAELMEMEETLIALILQQIQATPQAYEVIDEGRLSYYRYPDEQYYGVENYEVIKTQVEWEAFWAEHTTGIEPVPEVPVVDFTTKMVVINMLGTYNVWNYDISVTDVATADGYTLVTVERWAPGYYVQYAFSNPFSIITVDKTSEPVFIIDAFTNNVIEVVE